MNLYKAQIQILDRQVLSIISHCGVGDEGRQELREKEESNGSEIYVGFFGDECKQQDNSK